MKIIGIIPARFKSTRFEGKPLALINDKPMIWWVYQQAKKVKELDQVIVATEDSRIIDECEKLGLEVCLTKDTHSTGTDRVAEVANLYDADIYVNIQGDEPMIEPENIRKAILPFLEDMDVEVTNLMTKIKNPVDVINNTVPKVLVNSENVGIYLTRAAAPYPKSKLDFNFFKQVCVYGFTKEALSFFASTKRGNIESIEDIEILRFIENYYKVKFIEVKSDTVAVDTLKDLEKVRKLMINKG